MKALGVYVATISEIMKNGLLFWLYVMARTTKEVHVTDMGAIVLGHIE